MDRIKIKLNQDYQLRESDIADELMVVKSGETHDFHPHEARDVLEAGFGEEVKADEKKAAAKS